MKEVGDMEGQEGGKENREGEKERRQEGGTVDG